VARAHRQARGLSVDHLGLARTVAMSAWAVASLAVLASGAVVLSRSRSTEACEAMRALALSTPALAPSGTAARDPSLVPRGVPLDHQPGLGPVDPIHLVAGASP